MKRSRFEQAVEEETEINLSPMIDCIFILLIFFIVATVFVDEKGMQVAKPDLAATAVNEDTESVALEITAEDKIIVEDKQVRLSEIPRIVSRNMKNKDTPVVIRAQAGASHGIFVSVWDAAKRGGAQQLSFTTLN